MKVKCYSVRLQALASISGKCYKAYAFDGSEALIPKSQVYGRDWSVSKTDAYWISAWILGRVNLQHSAKKEGWFDSETMKMMPTYTKKVHTPERKEPIDSKPDKQLLR